MKNYKIEYIVKWLQDYIKTSNAKGFVVGVSGGIDSALVSTLCCETGLPTYVVSMPIHQEVAQLNRARRHMSWLTEQYGLPTGLVAFEKDLTNLYDVFDKTFWDTEKSQLSLANSKSRLRMAALYNLAQAHNCLVVGTGNRVEDFGVGFFTKFGDGGVDISPIADLYKSEVLELAQLLGINDEILKAQPTDGLWNDNRTDESQIGATYTELEFVMENDVNASWTDRQIEVLKIYNRLHSKNGHKMHMPPVCVIPEESKGQ